jgi:hypothetical protein
MEKKLPNEDHANGNESKGAPGQNKEYNIIVNGRPKVHQGKWITFEQVVELAFGASGNDGRTIYTITYSKGEDSKPKGTLTTGEKVRVKDGMIFNVTPTNKS